MTGFLTSGPDYFPGWVSIVFSVGLALGVVHHLPCLIFGHGNRWFHAGHTAMALSMIYMFLSMSYSWNWLPAAWQMWFFVATSILVVGYLLAAFIGGKPVNALWILLLVQQAGMAYMWYPMMSWNATVVFVLVSWFGIETIGWAANLLPDDTRQRENRAWFPYELAVKKLRAQRLPTPQPVAAGPAAGLATDPAPPDATDCHTSAHLVVSDWKDRTLMTIMALSMGYMFYGMQLLAVAAPPMAGH